MTDTPMAATRDELADTALKHYDELVKAAWPDGSSLSTIPQAIEAWRNQPSLEQELLETRHTVVEQVELRAALEQRVERYGRVIELYGAEDIPHLNIQLVIEAWEELEALASQEKT